MNTSIDSFLENAARTTVLVVGDVMLDAYLWGRVERISPEAPVPVVQVSERSARLGGAANVALNLRALGAMPVVVSTIGNDKAGDDLAQCFLHSALDSMGLVRSATRRTTVKTRVISGHQHVVRVDEEETDDLAPADQQALLRRVADVVKQCTPAAIVLEDYNKGVLTEHTIEAIIAMAHKAGIPVAVDPKHKNFFAYRGVALFKPNLKELRDGLKMEVNAADLTSVRTAVSVLEQRLGNEATLVTLSEHGIYAHEHGTEHHFPAHRRTIADVSGAGDTVIAVATLALAQRQPLHLTAALSNLAGGLVCETVGVAPIDVERFRAEAIRLNVRP